MDTTASPPRVIKVPVLVAAAVAIVLVDQATKFWAESALTGRAPVRVFGDFIQFRLLYNPGAAFSIGEGATWIFTIVTAVAVVVLARYVVKPAPAGQVIALTMLLGGATTHLLDRLFRAPGFARGHVVDFIDYNGWFVGNVADIALTVGAVLLVISSLRTSETSEPS